MSSMMEQVQSEHGGQGSVTSFAQIAPTHRIKRLGGRPLVFEGAELAMAMSFTPTLSYWYEVNLFRTSDQRFVASVKLFYVSADERDTIRAWECDTLDEAIERLARYDAAEDVQLVLENGDPERSAAEIAAYSMNLVAQVKGYRHHYASLIGEFLHDLETGV